MEVKLSQINHTTGHKYSPNLKYLSKEGAPAFWEQIQNQNMEIAWLNLGRILSNKLRLTSTTTINKLLEIK